MIIGKYNVKDIPFDDIKCKVKGMCFFSQGTRRNILAQSDIAANTYTPAILFTPTLAGTLGTHTLKSGSQHHLTAAASRRLYN